MTENRRKKNGKSFELYRSTFFYYISKVLLASICPSNAFCGNNGILSIFLIKITITIINHIKTTMVTIDAIILQNNHNNNDGKESIESRIRLPSIRNNEHT